MRIPALFVAVAALMLNLYCISARAANQVVYTDDMIDEFFKDKKARQSHGIMMAQRERLRGMMDGFIIGDPELIRSQAAELNEAMKHIVQTYPPTADNSAVVWDAMSSIVNQSQSVVNELANKDYPKAYGHYTKIVASCIQCHQVARSWGKFETPVAEAEIEAEAEAEAEATPNRK